MIFPTGLREQWETGRLQHFHESVHAFLKTIILEMRREKTCILASVSRNFRIVIAYMLAGVLAR